MHMMLQIIQNVDPDPSAGILLLTSKAKFRLKSFLLIICFSEYVNTEFSSA